LYDTKTFFGLRDMFKQYLLTMSFDFGITASQILQTKFYTLKSTSVYLSFK